MIDLGLPAEYAYIALGFIVAFGLIKLGHRILALLRDFRDFLDGD